MCQWLRLQLGRGRVGRRRIVSEAVLREIHTPQVAARGTPEWPEFLEACYALGWGVQPYRGHRWITHGGNLSGFNSHLSFMPDAEAGVICLTNIGASPVAAFVPLLIYDRLLGLDVIDWRSRWKRKTKAAAQGKPAPTPRPVRGTRPSHPLADYAGQYLHAGYGPVRIVTAGNALKLHYNRLTFRLRHYHYDQFRMRSEPHGTEDIAVSFRLDGDGQVAGVAIAFEPAVEGSEFAREKEEGKRDGKP